MKNTMIHNLVKHLPGLKHIKSEFYLGFVLYTFLISAFLTLGVGEMWGGKNINWQGKVYFRAPNNWDLSSYSYVQAGGARTTSTSTDTYIFYFGQLTNISNTRLYYKSISNDHSSWGQTEYVFFSANDHNYGDGTFKVNNNVYYTTPVNYDFNNSSNYYLYNPSSEGNGASVSGNWNSSRDNFFKKTYTIQVKVKKVGSSSYTTPTSSTEMPASSVSVTAYYLNGDASSTSNTKSLSGTTYSTTFYGCPGGKITLSQTAKTGYTFDGYYVSSSSITSPYYPTSTDAITIEARYTEVSTPSIGLSAPSSGVRGNSITLTASTSNASTPTIYYEYSTSSTFASSVTTIASTTSTSQSWTIPSGTTGTTYYLRAKMTISGTTYYSSILTLTAYGKKIIHVKNSNNWGTLYLYAWDSSDNKLNGAWPGKTGTGSNGLSCTNTGGQWWDVVITSQISGFILNANVSGDANQTADLSYSTYTNDRCLAIGTGSGKRTLPNTAVTCPSEPTDVTTTAAPTASTNTGMTIKGSIGGNGNDKITSYGFYYGTTTACSTQAQVSTTDKTGDFTKALTGLTAGTTYYFKAYATNGQGTTYGTRYSYKIPYSVTVSKSTGCQSITPSAGSYYYNAGFTVTAVAATGYNFSTWTVSGGSTSSPSSPSTGTNTVTFTPTADNATITATYTPKTTSITLSQIGAATTGSVTTRTGTYNAAMPAITGSGSLPIAPNGYCFMGYYGSANGEGTKYYNADGSSAHTWDQVGATATLYAYFKKAEIVDLSIEPSLAEKGGTVEVTPEIDPKPAGTTSVCYYLLYMNGNKVDPQPDFGNPNSSGLVSFTAPNVAGTFILAAALRTGSSCGGGTLLDSVATHTFQVGGEYSVTVKYMRDNVAIKPQTKVAANPSAWTEITAPDIIGYSFSKWKAGDGVTIEGAASGESTSATIRFQATYDGTLTALYTKRNIIYFNNTYTQWSDVYVYFYNSGKYWAEGYGTGAYKGKYFDGDKPYWETEHGHMTRIEGTNIWYFDYTEAGYSTRSVVAFANMDKSNSGTDNTSDNSKAYFANTTTTPIQVARRSDHNANLPMFVPIAQTGVKLNSNKANYTSEGYWMNYPENTGYSIRLFNQITGVGTYEVDSIPVEFTEDYTLAEPINVLMDAGHTYGFKLFRADNVWMGNTGTMTNGASGDVGQTAWEFRQKNDDSSDKPNCGLTTTAAGTYTFSVSYGKKGSSYDYLVGVHYPVVAGDFQILYHDNAEWSQGSTHGTGWVHPSRTITARPNGVDTISFFVAKGTGISASLKARKVNSITAGTGAITWGSLNIAGATSKSLTVDSAAVWNFKVTQGATAGTIASIENIGAYTGNYYIRCNAMNNKWGNFRDDHDHLMTYSAFSEDRSQNGFGDLFSHYKAKWCPRSTNVKFCIANDYSLCISDTLIRDITKSWPENMDATGTLYSEGGISDVTADKWSANIRFMWNRKTNKISRAYVASATNTTRKFLVLRGCDTKIHDHNNNVIPATAYLGENEILLEDDQNWIYETTIKAKPTARVKLYACYGEKPANVVNAQYFRGAYDSNNCGSDANSIQILGGSGSNYYLMRVIYDFKTNRLITAWLPDGTPVDQAPLNIDADVMVIRDHQQAAEAITFTNSTKSLGNVKTVYGTIRFNRWTLNNRYRMSDTNNPSDPSKWSTTETDINKDHCNTTAAISRYHAPLPPHLQTSSFERNNYFISFPFDVQLSEVFGFGTYGTHWIISKYNGLRRAQVGYFRDNCINGDFDCTNWDYIWDRTGVTLKAYEGYLLSLDLDLMQYDDTTNFWLNQIHQVELYFPSKVPMSTITTTNVTLPGMTDDYLCTKNYNKDGTNPEGDRRVKDSYWRCIGVPSYAPYGTVLKTGETEIQWNTDYTWYEDQRSFPFLYEWNTTDNTLTPQRTKTFNFKPLHSYLVQNKNTITWTAVSATPSSIVRRQRTEAQQEYTWRLNLTGNDNDESDTYIRMTDDEEVTEGFDFGPDMIKKFRDGYIVDANGDPIWDSSIDDYKQGVLHSDIYSILGYEYLAANSIPLNTTSTTIIPIGVRLKKAGEFTLSMPDGTYGVSITLVDNNTGARTELGAGFTYSFESEAGQYDDRFYLEIAKIKDIATGTEEIGEPSKSDVRKVMINGILYIVRGDQIFDALGNRVE